MIPRRTFIAGLGAAAASPLAARGQRQSLPVIGFLSSASADLYVDAVRAFRQGLNEVGYVEGRNVAIEFRWADGQNDRLPELAGDLVRRQVNVIAAPGSTPAAVAAKAATSTIPILFQTAADPIEIGFVAKLSQPGGNLTGVATFGVEVGPKRLELLHEAMPTATRMALLINPTSQNLTESIMEVSQAAAQSLGVQFDVVEASTDRDLEMAFATMAQLQAGALVIAPDALFTSRSEELAALALRHAVPSIYQWREFAVAGGMMSYGGSFAEGIRAIGVYAGRILNGEKPADLPVQQFTKVGLIVNLKTARALGITLPVSLVALADEVIE